MVTYIDNDDYARLIAQFKRHEGTKRDKQGRHIAYLDSVDKLTIGYGHNLDANPIPGLGKGSTIDDAHAEEILRDDVDVVERQLRRALPWAMDLSPARYAVLVDMAFNMGLAGLLGFKNTLSMIERGDYAKAAQNMLQSKWATQVKGRARELSEQMRRGAWVGVK